MFEDDLNPFCLKCKRYKGVGYCPYCSPEKDAEFKKLKTDVTSSTTEFDFEKEKKETIDVLKKIFEPAEEALPGDP